MELEVLRYTNRISSEAHREVSGAGCWNAVRAGLGRLHRSVGGRGAALRRESFEKALHLIYQAVPLICLTQTALLHVRPQVMKAVKVGMKEYELER